MRRYLRTSNFKTSNNRGGVVVVDNNKNKKIALRGITG